MAPPGSNDTARHPSDVMGTGARLRGAMTAPDELVRQAEARLDAATRQLTGLERDLGELEAQLHRLETDLAGVTAPPALSPWASVRAGLAPPLAALSAGLFFDTGVWPLGLLACVAGVAEALLLPLLNRSAR